MTAKRLEVPQNDVLLDSPTPVLAPAWGTAPRQLAEALRVGLCPKDGDFDCFLTYELQVVSEQHWTPLAVAQRAAKWFYELNVRSVADIGSGAGKFCVAAALAGRCHYTGLEQRLRLVSAARALAKLFGLNDRVEFVHGTLGHIATPVADAYYLYNPFGENLFSPSGHVDEEVEFSDARYAHDIAAVGDLLQQAAVGTYVLTYNGFGGRVPSCYDEVRVARDLPNVLRLFQKTRQRRTTHGSSHQRTPGRPEPTSLARVRALPSRT